MAINLSVVGVVETPDKLYVRFDDGTELETTREALQAESANIENDADLARRLTLARWLARDPEVVAPLDYVIGRTFVLDMAADANFSEKTDGGGKDSEGIDGL